MMLNKNALLAFMVYLCCQFSWAHAQTQHYDLPKSGLNVFWGDFTYFTTALPFTNAIKHSSGFLYGGEPVEEIDENGYPTQIIYPEGAVNYIFLETTHYPTGDYTLMWEGSGSMRIQTCDQIYEFDETSDKTQKITIENACEGGIILTLLSTNTEDYIRNLRLYLPGYDDISGYWTQNYIDYFSQFGLLRFAWGAGMYSAMSQWNERKQLTDLSWAAGDATAEGIPYEAMAALANAAGVDLWVCVPARADDAYETQMAHLFRDHLNTQHQLWIEWANEQWNCGEYGYAACEYICEITGNCGEDQDETYEGPSAPEIYAREIARTTDNFISVFENAQQRDRLITVLGGQQNNAWQLETAATELNRLGKMDNIDVMAIGAYFNQTVEYDPLTPVLDQGMDAIMNAVRLTMEDLFARESDAGIEFFKNLNVATSYAKPMVAYEGGQHFTDWIGVPGELVAEINRHPAMYQIYRDFYDAWDSLGNATFVHYTSYGDYSRNEAFGLQEYYGQPHTESHKLRAALDWEAAGSQSYVLATSVVPKTTFTVYPNPASDVLNVQLPNRGGALQWRLYSINGVLQMTKKLLTEERFEILVSNVKPGYYLLKIIQQDQIFTKKVIIQ